MLQSKGVITLKYLGLKVISGINISEKMAYVKGLSRKKVVFVFWAPAPVLKMQGVSKTFNLNILNTS